MKKFFLSLLRVCISGAAALVVLSLFCLGYNYTGCHVRSTDGSTDYKWESGQFFSTMKEGLSWFFFDKNGFNNINDTDFSQQPIDILLMGSSHMEAVQVKKDENLGALLNEYLPELRTYNIGISGHVIFTSVQNLRNAVEAFPPRKYVLVESLSVALDQDSMRQVLEGAYPRIPSYDSGLLYQLQKKIPAVKLLYKSLEDWRDASVWRSGGVSEEPETLSARPSAEYTQLLGQFLDMAVDSLPQGCKLIIFYHPDTAIDETGALISDVDADYAELFGRLCAERGIIFLNEAQDFARLYEDEAVLAHGFVNTALGAGHLNKYGHRVIAERLSQVIKADLEARADDAE